MKYVTVVMAVLCAIVSAHAGLVVSKNEKVIFGEVTEKGNTIFVKIKLGDSFGKSRYKKNQLIWWTSEESVSDLYSGAKQAHTEKNYDVAKILALQSVERESKNKAQAQELLTIMKNLNQTGNQKVKASSSTVSSAEEGDTATNNAKKSDDDAGGKNSGLYEKLKSHLLDPSTGKRFKSKTWGKAKYYLLCFVSLRFAENRDLINRIGGKHGEIKDDYKGQLEVLFYPIDNDPNILSKYIPLLKISFPVLKRSFAAKNELFKLRKSMSSASFAIVDANGSLVNNFKGENWYSIVLDLSEKLNE